MDLLIAGRTSEARESFSSSEEGGRKSIAATTNLVASLFLSKSYRSCVREATAALQGSPDPLALPRLLLLRGAASARLKGDNNRMRARQDWERGRDMFLVEGDPNRLQGDFLTAMLLERLCTSEEGGEYKCVDKLFSFISPGLDVTDLSPPPASIPVDVAPPAPPISSSTSPPPQQSRQLVGVEKAFTLRSNKATTSAISTAHTSKLDFDSMDSRMMKMSLANLSHATDNPLFNKAIAMGFLQVNTGKLREAKKTFNAILKDDSRCSIAYSGRGSSFALMGDLKSAYTDFCLATEFSPDIADFWKRKGQTAAALGRQLDAISDLNCAVVCMEKKGEIDPDVYNQLGNILYKCKRFHIALVDGFEKCLSYLGRPKKDDKNYSKIIGGGGLSSLYNMTGLCYSAVGEYRSARENLEIAIRLEPKFKEAHLNIGQLTRDFGDGKLASRHFADAWGIDAEYVNAYYLHGLCLYGMGEIRRALEVFEKGLRSAGDDTSRFCQMLGLCYQALGQYSKAIRLYDEVGPDVVSAWYNREIALCCWSKLDHEVRSLFVSVQDVIKEGWCKKIQVGRRHRDASKDMEYLQVTATINSDVGNTIFDEEGKRMIALADKIGGFLQLDSQGFMTNKRQHRQFGFAVMEASEALKGVKEGNAGWRSTFDIIVRWRQISEFNDPVWWIDELTREGFQEGFGLQTPMMSGELKVFRYHSYYKKGFEALKELMVEQCGLTGRSEGSAVATAVVEGLSTLEEVWDMVGGDFWVVVPCYGITGSRKMEGTRLTLRKIKEGEGGGGAGFEFCIRTPGTPERWQHFTEEFNTLWVDVERIVSKTHTDDDDTEVFEVALKVFWLWISYAPLTRGSASVGYAMLLVILRTKGFNVIGAIPKNVQLDWEAILNTSGHPQEFVSQWKPWLQSICKQNPKGSGLVMWRAEGIADALPSLRHRITALNAFQD